MFLRAARAGLLVFAMACSESPETAAGTGGSGAGSSGVGGSSGMGGTGATQADASLDANALVLDASADATSGDARVDAETNINLDAGVDASVVPDAVVRMLHRVTPDDDGYIASANNGDAAARAWLTAHWQAFEGFGGGPTRAATSWLAGGLIYFDITAVNTSTNPPDAHILKRPGTGERCYNPWGGNPNPQVTWNITSATTRAYLIAEMQSALNADPWAGLWLDDVNLDTGSSCVGPNDEPWYTDFGNGWDVTWAEAVTTFVEEIRAAFPNKTLLQNAPWFSRRPDRWMDPYVVRQLQTTDLANREGGILDDGLTTGSGEWSVKALYDYVDAVHAAGAGIVWDSFPSNATQQKYALAAYFIGYSDKDVYGDAYARQPASWPALYDVNLGRPLGLRMFDGNARFTREFEHGTVILDVSTKTGTIPGAP